MGRQVAALLGEQTCDVYLNGVAYWNKLPAAVWGYMIGGYHNHEEMAELARAPTPRLRPDG